VPYDPLFVETPLSPELRAELGIPAGATVHRVRFPNEESARTDRRLRGYQAVLVCSVDPDAEGKVPTTWAPGMEPYRFRVARIRFRDDVAYGEIRFSAVEGVSDQICRPHRWDGRPLITEGERRRVEQGLHILWGLLPTYGPQPQAIEDPSYEQTREDKAWKAALEVGRDGGRVTQQLVADKLGIDDRTLRSWFPHGAWKPFRQRVLQALSAKPDPPPS
jgi:hypothetical protein